jgi:hypothetical protein
MAAGYSNAKSGDAGKQRGFCWHAARLVLGDEKIISMGVPLAGQLAQELPLIHTILEGFASVDEDYGNFVIELPPQFVVRIYVHFPPGKAAAARELGETLFDHFAQMTSLA